MLNIELPWIDGLKLTNRWYPFLLTEDVDYEELHHCIFELGLPVYNYLKKLQEGIVDEVESACDDDGIPLSCYPEIPTNKHYIWGSDKRNALFFFDRYVKNPHLFDPKDTFFSNALRRIRTNDRTHPHAHIWDILKCMHFKMEDVKEFEAKHGKGKKGLPDKNEKSEFAVYDSIVNGELRPFLEIYSSKKHIENLTEELLTISCVTTEDGLVPAPDADSDLWGVFVKRGDEIEIDENDPKKPGELVNITKNELDELMDVDVPPPPDLKAEYFLELIAVEYYKIQQRAKRFLKTSQEENQISLYANKTIQIAKRIAVEAHDLSKRLKPEENISRFGTTDLYIIDFLKDALIESILFYQEMFGPYLKIQPERHNDLRINLYEEHFRLKYKDPSYIIENCPLKKSDSIQKKTTETGPEDFIRNLRVSYKSDSEVTIRAPKLKTRVFNYDDLGFKDNEVWKAFIYTIKEPPHIYETGPAHIKKGRKRERIPQYDRKRGRLRSINEKLIVFFNKEYGAQLTEDFEFYDIRKEEGSGKYKYKFQVSRDDGISEDYHSIYERFSEDQLIDEMNALAKKYSTSEDKVVMEKVVVASEVAIKKGFLSNDEIKKMFKLDANKKEYSLGEVRDDDLHEE